MGDDVAEDLPQAEIRDGRQEDAGYRTERGSEEFDEEETPDLTEEERRERGFRDSGVDLRPARQEVERRLQASDAQYSDPSLFGNFQRQIASAKSLLGLYYQYLEQENYPFAAFALTQYEGQQAAAMALHAQVYGTTMFSEAPPSETDKHREERIVYLRREIEKLVLNENRLIDKLRIGGGSEAQRENEMEALGILRLRKREAETQLREKIETRPQKKIYPPDPEDTTYETATGSRRVKLRAAIFRNVRREPSRVASSPKFVSRPTSALRRMTSQAPHLSQVRQVVVGSRGFSQSQALSSERREMIQGAIEMEPNLQRRLNKLNHELANIESNETRINTILSQLRHNKRQTSKKRTQIKRYTDQVGEGAARRQEIEEEIRNLKNGDETEEEFSGSPSQRDFEMEPLPEEEIEADQAIQDLANSAASGGMQSQNRLRSSKLRVLRVKKIVSRPLGSQIRSTSVVSRGRSVASPLNIQKRDSRTGRFVKSAF